MQGTIQRWTGIQGAWYRRSFHKLPCDRKDGCYRQISFDTVFLSFPALERIQYRTEKERKQLLKDGVQGVLPDSIEKHAKDIYKTYNAEMETSVRHGQQFHTLMSARYYWSSTVA